MDAYFGQDALLNADMARKLLERMPKLFAHARKSAMASSGWKLYSEMRNHIEYGGTADSAELSPFAARYQKSSGKKNKGKWVKRRDPDIPLYWLGKFARYRLDKGAFVLSADYGKGRGGDPETLDPNLSDAVQRAEKGQKIAVTDAMRRKFAATGGSRKNRKIGVDFFPLKKTTTMVEVPARPVMTPVGAKVMPKIPEFFAQKFWASVERNLQKAKVAG